MAAVTQRFRDVLRLHGVCTGEVGDAARDLEDAVIGARREVEARHRLA